MDTDPETLGDKQFHAFVDHVAKLRMTKAGRFARANFTSGSVLDVVPKGRVMGTSRAKWKAMPCRCPVQNDYQR